MRALVAVALLFVLFPQMAWAHAQLLSTSSPDNVVLDLAPEALTLTFNEPVSPLTLKLIGPDGVPKEVAGRATGNRVHMDVPANVGTGTHVLSWRVVSSDGHPISGSLVFSVGRITGAADAAAVDPTVAIALWAGKVVLYICLFTGVGSAVFTALAPIPPGARFAAEILCALGLVAAGVTLGLQGLDALGMPTTSIVQAQAWSVALSTSYGLTVMVAGVAFLAAFGSQRVRRGSASISLALLAGGLAALSLTFSGHASVASPQWLTRPSVFLHVGGLIFWVGALLPLSLLLRSSSDFSNRALASFSACVPYAAVPLVLTGGALAVIQMGVPGREWNTPYGFILAAKLCLLVVLFGLALINRLWLTIPALAGDSVALRRLRGSIVLEMVLVVFILGLAAGWRFTPPPRALSSTPAEVALTKPLLLHLMDAKTMVMTTMTPGAAGPVVIDLWVTDSEGHPKAVQSVGVTLSSSALDIEPIRRNAIASGGAWKVQGLTIPLAGDWVVAIEVRVDRFELTRLEYRVVIP